MHALLVAFAWEQRAVARGSGHRVPSQRFYSAPTATFAPPNGILHHVDSHRTHSADMRPTERPVHTVASTAGSLRYTRPRPAPNLARTMSHPDPRLPPPPGKVAQSSRDEISAPSIPPPIVAEDVDYLARDYSSYSHNHAPPGAIAPLSTPVQADELPARGRSSSLCSSNRSPSPLQHSPALGPTKSKRAYSPPPPVSLPPSPTRAREHEVLRKPSPVDVPKVLDRLNADIISLLKEQDIQIEILRNENYDLTRSNMYWQTKFVATKQDYDFMKEDQKRVAVKAGRKMLEEKLRAAREEAQQERERREQAEKRYEALINYIQTAEAIATSSMTLHGFAPGRNHVALAGGASQENDRTPTASERYPQSDASRVFQSGRIQHGACRDISNHEIPRELALKSKAVP